MSKNDSKAGCNTVIDELPETANSNNIMDSQEYSKSQHKEEEG
jgi:hypothetical protein